MKKVVMIGGGFGSSKVGIRGSDCRFNEGYKVRPRRGFEESI